MLSSDDDNDENRLDSKNTEIFLRQKSLISKHPLFPVLVYVLERCEQATLNPSLSTIKDDCQTTSFESNLKVFLSKNNDLLMKNADSSAAINQFYIDAMQVLRIHLLELEKVNDLCRDFCQRYVACLKVKFNVNHIFTDEDDDDEDDDFELHSDEDLESTEEDFMCDEQQVNKDCIVKDQHYGKQSIITADFNSICNQYTTHFNGQTPFSQIIGSSSSSILSDPTCLNRRKQPPMLSSSKRSILPKSATSVMRSWLFQHITHPYPTEDEKRTLSHTTNLSMLQVNNWFINARRRILQPMLGTSNPDLISTKKKKRHDTIVDDTHPPTPSRQMSNINRYWPSSLAQFHMHKQ